MDNSERIDKFLHEQMTPEESEAFLNDLRTDKDLRDEAQSLAMLIKEMRVEQAKQDAEIIEEVLAAKERVAAAAAKIIPLSYIRKIAAVIIPILMVVGYGGNRWVAYKQYKTDWSDKIFAVSYNQEYLTYSDSRGGNSDVYEELYVLYGQIGTDKEIDTTISRLQEIYDNIKLNVDGYEDYIYEERNIAWYLALAYIKDHNLDKARELLKPLADDADEDARIILERIDNIKSFKQYLFDRK